MTQSGQTSRHDLLASRQNLGTTPEDGLHNRSVAVPDIAEQMELNISTVIQVGHQLAIIGDEFNRTCRGKLEDSLFNRAKGIAASAFQTCVWSNFKSIVKSFGNFFNNNWRKKIFDCGHWPVPNPLEDLHSYFLTVEFSQEPLMRDRVKRLLKIQIYNINGFTHIHMPVDLFKERQKILLIPLQYVCQKWVPATLFAILMCWLITYGLQN